MINFLSLRKEDCASKKSTLLAHQDSYPPFLAGVLQGLKDEARLSWTIFPEPCRKDVLIH